MGNRYRSQCGCGKLQEWQNPSFNSKREVSFDVKNETVKALNSYLTKYLCCIFIFVETQVNVEGVKHAPSVYMDS